jgi:glycosyltransferase involved in cell wall biosynthesis
MTFYGDADLLLNIKVTKAVDTSSFFSSKLFEYMATGRPVLTTNMAQLEAEYGEVLYVLDDETVPGLVAALDRLRNTARAELVDRGLRGQRFAAENLTWERQGRRVRELIERVVRSEESAPG